VRDTGVGRAAGSDDREGHFGLRQVRERLATLHGARASLSLQEPPGAEGGTLAVVRLPLAVAP
jgi:nitrate/nitrite-specific signal transduction histidine kinase